MSLYKRTDTGEIRDLDDSVILALSGTPKGSIWVSYTAPSATTTVPYSISNAQLRAALIVNGIYPSVIDTLIASISSTEQRAIAQSWWDYANTMERDSTLVATFATALGKDSAWVDQLFIYADTLST